jgi:hypothetical protein
MKAQIPAEGILKTHDWGNAKVYKIACDCGQPDHEHNVWVEADECGINVNIYTTVKTDCWSEGLKPKYDIDNIWLQEFEWFWKSLYNGLARRLKLTKSIWFKGYADFETTICMTEQQTLNYAETLKSAITDVKEFRKPATPKKKSAIIKPSKEELQEHLLNQQRYE